MYTGVTSQIGVVLSGRSGPIMTVGALLRLTPNSVNAYIATSPKTNSVRFFGSLSFVTVYDKEPILPPWVQRP